VASESALVGDDVTKGPRLEIASLSKLLQVLVKKGIVVVILGGALPDSQQQVIIN